jgi:hypothetical protein
MGVSSVLYYLAKAARTNQLTQSHSQSPLCADMNTTSALLVLPFILLVVLVSSKSGDQKFCVIVTLCRPPHHQDWGRARTASNRFARDDKELGHQLGEAITRRTTS